PAAENRFDVSLRTRKLARTSHIFSHAGVTREVAIDELLRGRALDVELRSQSKRAHAVDQTEVDRFDVAALLGRDLIHRYAEDFRGGGTMDVGALRKRAQQRCVVR